jgi:hypothetical protein
VTDINCLLKAAALGWHIFPLQPLGKTPMAGSHGLSDATTNADTIRAWNDAAPSANWAVNCGASGLVVIDVDKYKPGCLEAWAGLDLEHGLPRTLRIRTPRGGEHLYFTGRASSTVEKLGKGIDTRGAGGYVVIPPSETIDGPYLVAEQVPPAPLPESLAAAIGLPAERVAQEADPVCVLDTPTNILAASDFLRSTDAAIEGSGGDAATLRAAMGVRDRGVSREVAIELMCRDYNPRCSPPWELSALERKVDNAYRYARNAPGVMSLEAAGFKPVEVAEPVKASPLAERASTFDATTLPQRPWILGYDLMAGFLTATIAQGGVGKSMIAMAESISVATGRPITGVPVIKAGPAWIYNTEDPMDELKRRVLAIAQHYAFTPKDLHDVHVSSGRSNPLILAKSEHGVVTVNQNMIETVCGYIREYGIVTWCVDPFVHTHYCEENSNSEMAIVLHAFGQIAERTGVAINLVHHTSKGSAGAGDIDKARGASAFGGAVRIMRHAQTLSLEDCSRYGIGEGERKKYIGLYDAKGNMSPPADRIRWFEKVSVLLPNGDNVGTVKVSGISEVESKDSAELRDKLFTRIRTGDIESGAELSREVGDLLVGTTSHVPDTTLQVRVKEEGGKYFLHVEQHLDWLA